MKKRNAIVIVSLLCVVAVGVAGFVRKRQQNRRTNRLSCASTQSIEVKVLRDPRLK